MCDLCAPGSRFPTGRSSTSGSRTIFGAPTHCSARADDRAALARRNRAVGKACSTDEASNLRGRGGAGFTGMKWESCRNATGAERYIVCNADEGEPGTFKDRVLLERDADLVFEGMAIGGLASAPGAGSSICAASIAISRAAEAEAERDAARPLLGGAHPGRARIRFRRRDPARCRRLHLRRGIGADRIARRQARHAAHRPPFPVTVGLSREADRGRQRRDPVPRRPTSRCTAARVPGAARSPRPAPRSFRCPATALGRDSTNIRSASRVEQFWRIAARSDSRRCRSAALRATACRPTNSAAPSPSKTCRRPAPSWCSASYATCSRSRAIRAFLRPRELRLLHAMPRRDRAARDVMDKIAEGRGSRYEIDE